MKMKKRGCWGSMYISRELLVDCIDNLIPFSPLRNIYCKLILHWFAIYMVINYLLLQMNFLLFFLASNKVLAAVFSFLTLWALKSRVFFLRFLKSYLELSL